MNQEDGKDDMLQSVMLRIRQQHTESVKAQRCLDEQNKEKEQTEKNLVNEANILRSENEALREEVSALRAQLANTHAHKRATTLPAREMQLQAEAPPLTERTPSPSAVSFCLKQR